MASSIFYRATITQNPAWVQLLGLCPLLAVSTTFANSLGLAAASGLVLLAANTSISILRFLIPESVRLPCFVLIIATFTTVATLLLEAFAFDLYAKIALFVQIIVTNCMILGRAEAFASKQPVGAALLDALGTAGGFALALIVLGSCREVLGHGTLFSDLDLLLGTGVEWELRLFNAPPLAIVAQPPGAFIAAGLLFALAQACLGRATGSVSGRPAKTSTQLANQIDVKEIT